MKLVRDLIPQIIEENGKTCEYHIAKYDEYKARLYEKLREELDEFINTPCYEEAADIYEVLFSIFEIHEMSMVRVELAALDKRTERGGFKDRIILESVDESR
jgi:predicted house-cleaning noncanonical NTP pyrophosphatase (MazG superfamily)